MKKEGQWEENCVGFNGTLEFVLASFICTYSGGQKFVIDLDTNQIDFTSPYNDEGNVNVNQKWTDCEVK